MSAKFPRGGAGPFFARSLKSLFEHLYILIKNKFLHPMAIKLVLLLLSNNKSVMRYLVYYVIHNIYLTNDRGGTAISISDICNDILYNM